MSTPEKDPSIFNEPHLSREGFKGDPSEAKTDKVLDDLRADEQSEEQRIEHSVWDEPSLSRELVPEGRTDEITYSNWLRRRQEDTTTAKTWLITWAIVLAAGPWAILGSLLYSLIETEWVLYNALTIVVFGPMTEELMKVALALYVVEKRPFLFKSGMQIVLCAIAGGVVFAAVENLLYLYVYIQDPTAGLILWRWTVCVLLHTSCTLIASMGLVKIWRYSWRHRKRPPVSLAFSYLIMAVVIHGAYNTIALIFSIMDYSF